MPYIIRCMHAIKWQTNQVKYNLNYAIDCKKAYTIKLFYFSEIQIKSTFYEDVTIFDAESTNETSKMNTTVVIIAITTAVSGLVVVTGSIFVIRRGEFVFKLRSYLYLTSTIAFIIKVEIHSL